MAQIASCHGANTKMSLASLYHDIDCRRCKHTARHIWGRLTGTVYCLQCAGECRETPNGVVST